MLKALDGDDDGLQEKFHDSIQQDMQGLYRVDD